MKNTKFQEEVAIAGVINAGLTTPSTVLSGAVDMSLFDSIAAVLNIGTIVATGTVDAKLVSSATSGGTYTDITGKGITQLTAAGTDSNKQVIINCRSDELAAGLRFVKLSVTVGTANATLSATIFGRDSRYGPGTATSLTSLDEVVG